MVELRIYGGSGSGMRFNGDGGSGCINDAGVVV